MTPIAKDVESPRRPAVGAVGNALWSSAIDAFVKTILILVMGNVALAILGGIFGAMTPSPPPFLTNHSGVYENSNPSLMRLWGSAAREHEFAIVYVILFALGVRTRLVTLSATAGETASTDTRFQKIAERLSNDWFRLIVGNAFGALLSAIVIYFVESFTGTRFLVNLMLAAVLPATKTVATFILGAKIVDFVGGLAGWYGDNQLRFNFWIFYVAAVCDDLGIPNLKTLARFLWSRWRRRNLVQ